MTALTGTGTLLRVTLRRDRVLLPATILIFAVVAGASAQATVDVYPTASSRSTAAGLINATPALVALYGRVYDVTSLGAVSLLKLIGLGTAFVAVFTMLLVVRHTRGDEEVGRTELAASGVVGRFAPTAAALLVAAGSAVALGALTALALVGVGLPAGGAVAFGTCWACAGLVFAAVAAVAAQLFTSARTARGVTTTLLAAAYVVRAVGDTAGPGGHWVSWLSPIGWAQQIRPFAGDRWVVVPLPLVVAGALAALALVLVDRRDLGAGLLPDRPGPDRGRRLSSALALAWRLDRAALLGWTVGFALLGLVLGSILGNVGDMLTSPESRRFIARLGGVGSLTDAFLSAELGFVALFATVFGVSTVLRLRTEEATGRAEAVLATTTSRAGLAAGHVVVAVSGTAGLMVVLGVGTGLAHAASLGDGGLVARDLAAAVARIPAVWVLVALTLALYGLVGRRVTVVWAVVVGCVVVGQFGDLMALPRWVQHLSPYVHVAQLPGGPFDVLAGAMLLVVAAGLAGLGLVAFRRRDVVAD